MEEVDVCNSRRMEEVYLCNSTRIEKVDLCNSRMEEVDLCNKRMEGVDLPTTQSHSYVMQPATTGKNNGDTIGYHSTPQS
jgi:hypothetical protein